MAPAVPWWQQQESRGRECYPLPPGKALAPAMGLLESLLVTLLVRLGQLYVRLPSLSYGFRIQPWKPPLCPHLLPPPSPAPPCLHPTLVVLTAGQHCWSIGRPYFIHHSTKWGRPSVLDTLNVLLVHLTPIAGVINVQRVIRPTGSGPK